MAHFEEAQFIVSTHSPFVPASVENAALYYLYYNESGFVEASSLDLVNRAATADEISRVFFV